MSPQELRRQLELLADDVLEARGRAATITAEGFLSRELALVSTKLEEADLWLCRLRGTA